MNKRELKKQQLKSQSLKLISDNNWWLALFQSVMTKKKSRLNKQYNASE